MFSHKSYPMKSFPVYDFCTCVQVCGEERESGKMGWRGEVYCHAAAQDTFRSAYMAHPNCHTKSPFRIPVVDSMRDMIYHVDAAEVLPNFQRVSLEGWACFALSCRLFSSSSITPRPPVCSKKWLKTLLKFGTYR